MSAPGPWDPERAAWVRRYGRYGLSAQLPYLEATTWRAPDGAGIVVYVTALGVWVAAGPPLGPEEALPALTRAFVAAAAAAGAHAVFFGLPPQLAEAAGLRFVRCGEEPTWRAARWAEAGRRPELNRQLRRAQRLGVTLEGPQPPGPSPDASEVATLEALQARWLAGHALAPLQFVARATLREGAPHALRWVARARGAAVGVAVLLPNAPDGTFLLEQLLREPRAPNGCSEALVDAAVRHVAAHAPAAEVSLGIVALAGPVGWVLRLGRTLGRPLYPFAGLQAFRRKLRPDVTLPLGLACSSRCSRARAFVAVAVAFTGGAPARFAWRSLVAGPPPLLGAMAACLVPWTYALACVPPAFFAHPATQRAWVGFDVALTLALARLAWRPTLPWARALAWTVSLDALLTAGEAAFAHGRVLTSPWRSLAYVVAVAAPALSARVLWGCVLRLRRAGDG